MLFEIIRLQNLPVADFQPLLRESRREGFAFVDRLVTEYQEGANRFTEPGEALFAVYYQQSIIAVGGLNQDPYAGDAAVGRVRHVYVLPDHRRKGVGRLLMQRIIREAALQFHVLRLRTLNSVADKFYCTLGFERLPGEQDATHQMTLSD